MANRLILQVEYVFGGRLTATRSVTGTGTRIQKAAAACRVAVPARRAPEWRRPPARLALVQPTARLQTDGRSRSSGGAGAG